MMMMMMMDDGVMRMRDPSIFEYELLNALILLYR